MVVLYQYRKHSSKPGYHITVTKAQLTGIAFYCIALVIESQIKLQTYSFSR